MDGVANSGTARHRGLAEASSPAPPIRCPEGCAHSFLPHWFFQSRTVGQHGILKFDAR
jgi:hypothetical protein